MTAFFAAIFNAAGHGSALPFRMFIGPAGLGLAVWPLSFAATGVPHQYRLKALLVVVWLIALHCLAALFVLMGDGARLSGLHRMMGLRGFFWGWVGLVVSFELAAPAVIALQLWADGRRTRQLTDRL